MFVVVALIVVGDQVDGLVAVPFLLDLEVVRADGVQKVIAQSQHQGEDRGQAVVDGREMVGDGNKQGDDPEDGEGDQDDPFDDDVRQHQDVFLVEDADEQHDVTEEADGGPSGCHVKCGVHAVEEDVEAFLGKLVLILGHCAVFKFKVQVFLVRQFEVPIDDGESGGGLNQVNGRVKGAQDTQNDGSGADSEATAMSQAFHFSAN